MFFIFPVPLWFVVVWIAGGLVFALWEAMDDADDGPLSPRSRAFFEELRQKKQAEQQAEWDELLKPGSCPELQRLLKQLAASR